MIKNPKKKKISFISAIFLLLFFSNGFIFNEISLLWERDYKKPEKITEKNLIILGGYANIDRKRDKLQFAASSDRLWQGLYLQGTHSFDKVILSGGSGEVLRPEDRESSLVQEFLIKGNFRVQNLLIDSASRNTRENALEVKRMLSDGDSCILVTSAFHAYRARKCFEKENIPVRVIKSHFLSGQERDWSLSNLLLPQASVLEKWNYLIKEWVGIIMYKIKGYI